MFHIGSELTPLSCFGINLPLSEVYEILEDVDIKDRVVYKEGSLIIYGRFAIKIIEIKNLPVINLNIEKTSNKKWLKPMDKILKKLELKEKTGIGQILEVDNVLQILQNPENLEDEKKAVRFLIGRGPGLTPSGDDILMGYGTGLAIMGQSDEFFSVLKDILDTQTTEISIAYLKTMLNGYVNEDYKRINTAINENKNCDYEFLLKEIQKIGHTSGNDSLYGFHCAVKYLINRGK